MIQPLRPRNMCLAKTMQYQIKHKSKLMYLCDILYVNLESYLCGSTKKSLKVLEKSDPTDPSGHPHTEPIFFLTRSRESKNKFS
jgi:hypothetical protein